jgi:ribosomal protein S18 acetylase RimI-like enzyme
MPSKNLRLNLMGNSTLNVMLRTYEADDEAFAFDLYSSTRTEEMAAWGWDRSQQEPFLRMQFTGFQMHYRMGLPDADDRIILLDGDPVGRLIVARLEREIRLADISLLAEHRGKGIGSRLIRELIDEAACSGKSVTLHVDIYNEKAARLYERLGFEKVTNTGVHYFMEWKPRA